MNFLHYGFSFPAQISSNPGLIVFASPLVNSLRIVSRLLSLSSTPPLTLLTRFGEIRDAALKRFPVLTFDSMKLTLEELSPEIRSRLSNGTVQWATITRGMIDVGSYDNLLRMLQGLGVMTCYGIGPDYEWEDLTEYLVRYFPLKLGTHSVTGCIGVYRDETEALYKLALAATGPGHIVEIGSWTGGSSIALTLGCLDTGRDGITAIDRHFHDSYEGNLSTHGVLQSVRRLEMTARDAAQCWRVLNRRSNPEIRLLFIDGDHSYEGVSTDLSHWLPFVKPGGVVCLHDCSDTHPGVIRAIYEQILTSDDFYDYRQIRTLFIAKRKE